MAKIQSRNIWKYEIKELSLRQVSKSFMRYGHYELYRKKERARTT